MLSIMSQQANTNHNYNEIPFHANSELFFFLKREILSIGDNVETETRVYCQWERKMVQPLWKAVWQLLKKLQLCINHDSAISLLSIYLLEMRT